MSFGNGNFDCGKVYSRSTLLQSTGGIWEWIVVGEWVQRELARRRGELLIEGTGEQKHEEAHAAIQGLSS